MKGDFSRDTFDRRYRFSRVLMQQGRVLLDADWNEQSAILLHYLRTLAADVIGPHAGPGNGFRIGCKGDDGKSLHCDFRIGFGRYYVDGILVENLPPMSCPPTDLSPLLYSQQPDLPIAEEDELKQDTSYLVYLDVWERHLSHLAADHIREVALGGPDTATRAQVVWQVRVADECMCGEEEDLSCGELLERVIERRWRCMRARARVPASTDDPCVIPPESRYRGAENQLYRVEVHDGGRVGTGGDGPTFKWSRDNGSVVFAVRSLQGSIATLETLGPDENRTLREGDWVEIVDDRSELRGEPGVMVRVDAVDPVRFQVTLAIPEGVSLPVFSTFVSSSAAITCGSAATSPTSWIGEHGTPLSRIFVTSSLVVYATVLWRDTEPLIRVRQIHPFFFDGGGSATSWIEEGDTRPDELVEVLVARDDHGLEARLGGPHRQRADDVVRFVAIQLEDGNVEGGDDVADPRERCLKLRRHLLPGRLVFREDLVALRHPGVEHHTEILRLVLLQNLDEEPRDAPRGIRVLPAPGDERARDEREEGPVDECVAVQKVETATAVGSRIGHYSVNVTAVPLALTISIPPPPPRVIVS